MISKTSKNIAEINWNSTNDKLNELANYYINLFDNINEVIIDEFEKNINSILKGIKIEDYIRMNWCPMELSLKYEKLLSLKNNFYYNLGNKKTYQKNICEKEEDTVIKIEKEQNDIEQYINSIKEAVKLREMQLSDYVPPEDPEEDYPEIPEELAKLLND